MRYAALLLVASTVIANPGCTSAETREALREATDALAVSTAQVSTLRNDIAQKEMDAAELAARIGELEAEPEADPAEILALKRELAQRQSQLEAVRASKESAERALRAQVDRTVELEASAQEARKESAGRLAEYVEAGGKIAGTALGIPTLGLIARALFTSLAGFVLKRR